MMATMDPMITLSRPIDRLPMKKTASEHKEAMNCKSCRKRKIKCNRLKPSCEACQVFNCACIYDAIPKKRGPKTDILEALLKRVNGLEKRLKDEQKSASPEQQSQHQEALSSSAIIARKEEVKERSSSSEAMEKSQSPVIPSPVEQQQPRPEIRRVRSNPIPIEPAPQIHEALAFTDALLDTFFARVHNKPYYILDETATRHRLRDGRLPRFLVNAIHAVSIRYGPHLCGEHSGAMRSSHDYVVRSRAEIDVDEPSIDNLQALLLLAMANFQNGKGKRSYTLLTHAVSMAFALNLHRELPSDLRIATPEREGRRKLFWTCYLMDCFTVSGSKRPALISDESIHLRLPTPNTQQWLEGPFFPSSSSLPSALGSSTMLIEIVRILGVTNRYLGAGGVKGDSHFPWHAQSTLSRIRSDLDYWAASTQETFTSIDTLFGSADSPTLVLSKLIYHLIHCLIYRPFLPIDLSELSGNGQNQSWQIEATNLCFLHANAIAELVEIGKNAALLDWPSFVGYCICTAGTIHVHGAYYISYREGDAFCHSSEFLTREMAQLGELRNLWAGIQHQRDTLQLVYASHAQLVKALSQNPMRFSPVFQMEDFFDRYPDSYIDGAHCSFSDVQVEMGFEESPPAYDGFHAGPNPWAEFSVPAAIIPTQQQQHFPSVVRREKKRRRRSTATSSSLPYPTPKAEQRREGTAIEEEPAASHYQQQQQQHHQEGPVLYQGTFTPTFAFSPVQEQFGSGMENGDGGNDPFLNLLEQLAENDASGLGGGGGYGDFDFL